MVVGGWMRRDGRCGDGGGGSGDGDGGGSDGGGRVGLDEITCRSNMSCV